jgi:hypothetical protein
MSKELRRASMAGMGVEIGLQAYRNLAIVINRRYLRPKEVFRLEEDDEDGDRDENTEAMTADEQAGHTSHVAGMVYARGIMERDEEVASKRQRFRRLSVVWHYFLGSLPDPEDKKEGMMTENGGRKRPRAPFEEE